MIKNLCSQRGFTLIELMIAVAIIGILAAIAISIFQNMSESAQIAAEDGVLSALNSAAVITLGKLGVPPAESDVLLAVSPPNPALAALTGTANTGHTSVAYCATAVMWAADTAGSHPPSHKHEAACPP